MPSYTVHVRPHGPADGTAFDDAVLVKDGFSPYAFLLTLPWALWHRMWLVALLVLVFDIALVAAMGILQVHPAAAMGVQVLLSLLIGLEAPAIRSWHLSRKGKPAAFVVVADDERGADDKAALFWSQRQAHATPASPWRMPATTAPATPAGMAVPAAGGPVLGLFPDPERRL